MVPLTHDSPTTQIKRLKIYVASSWRNLWQPSVVNYLRARGHEVYDFRRPTPINDGFSWDEVSPFWKLWKPQDYVDGLEHPAAKRGFQLDMDFLDKCDICILVHPCGSSSHLELGYAVGSGKRTAVLFPHGFEPARVNGHSGQRGVPCPTCGDMDGCSEPARMENVQPELMAKMADEILVHKDNLDTFLAMYEYMESNR